MNEEEILPSLVGDTITSLKCEVGTGDVYFEMQSGRTVRFFHYQSCCETVQVEDINGDLTDIVGSPLTLSEEVSNAGETEYAVAMDKVYRGDSWTWTFYKFATIKGYVTIRWYGSSNGYYGEEVSIEIV